MLVFQIIVPSALALPDVHRGEVARSGFVMEIRYQGQWDVNMLADFCWTLKRETLRQDKKSKRNPLHRSFEEKRTRYSSKKENN